MKNLLLRLTLCLLKFVEIKLSCFKFKRNSIPRKLIKSLVNETSHAYFVFRLHRRTEPYRELCTNKLNLTFIATVCEWNSTSSCTLQTAFSTCYFAFAILYVIRTPFICDTTFQRNELRDIMLWWWIISDFFK